MALNRTDANWLLGAPAEVPAVKVTARSACCGPVGVTVTATGGRGAQLAARALACDRPPCSSKTANRASATRGASRRQCIPGLSLVRLGSTLVIPRPHRAYDPPSKVILSQGDCI